jgi:hypothetical protein
MIERTCEQCNAEFEVEAGDDSTVCASCLIELKKETRFYLDEPVSGAEIE